MPAGEVKNDIIETLERGVATAHLEIRYWLHRWYTFPRVFALAFDPRIGPSFVRKMLDVVRPEWGQFSMSEWISPSVTDAEREHLEALFEDDFHAEYRAGACTTHPNPS